MGSFSGDFGGSVFCGDLGILGNERGDGFGDCFRDTGPDFLGDSGPDFLGEGGGIGFGIGSGVGEGIVGVEPPGSDFPSNHKQI